MRQYWHVSCQRKKRCPAFTLTQAAIQSTETGYRSDGLLRTFIAVKLSAIMIQSFPDFHEEFS